MKKAFIYILSATMMLAACVDNLQNEPIPSDESGILITESISAQVSEGNTKATIATTGGAFAWTKDVDMIAVHTTGDGSHAACYVISGGASETAAEAGFTVQYYGSRDAFAIYPSRIVAADAENYGQEGHTLDVTLPDKYTLAEVSGETSPCPMIASNTGSSWEFKQLCGLLRLTVNDIPASTKRLEIDFDGKKVSGEFSIESDVTPGTSVLETADDANHDIITITKDGTDVVLGSEELVLNVPLPVGAYTNITVVAYDALSGGTPLKIGNTTFSYSANRAKGKKTAVAVTSDPTPSSFTFTFKYQGNNLGNNLRFVRLFSNQNKLHQDATTYGPYTTAAVGTSDPDIANPVSANLLFDRNPDDLLAFQVIAADGKVYAGNVDVPAGGFRIGKSYNLTANVNLYSFTVETNGKKIYFSPGDLGVEKVSEQNVYSFTEPFETWGWKDRDATKRVWFTEGEVRILDVNNGPEIYGIKWRDVKRSSTKIADSPYPYEWNNIVRRTNMNSGVSPYYRVTVYDPVLKSNHVNCLLLPPDETQSTEIGDDITSGTVTNYAKYLGKGFVLLISTGNASGSWSWTSTDSKEGWYWVSYNTDNRFYFIFLNSDTTPYVGWSSMGYKMRARFVRDVQ